MRVDMVILIEATNSGLLIKHYDKGLHIKGLQDFAAHVLRNNLVQSRHQMYGALSLLLDPN